MNFFKISNGKNIKYDILTTNNYIFVNDISKNTSINIIDKVVDYHVNKDNNGVRVLPKTKIRKRF